MAKAQQARSENFKTGLCRLSYAQSLFKPRGVNDGPPKYGCTLIFPNNTNRAAMDEAVRKVIEEKWGARGIERAKNGLIKLPFLAGDGKEARNKETGEIAQGLGPDFFFIRPQANPDRPPVIRWKEVDVPATPDEVYSGCYGIAVLNAFTWQHPQSGDGVSFGIRMFQKTKEGEILGGGGPIDPEEWFEPYVEDNGPPPEQVRLGRGAGGLFS